MSSLLNPEEKRAHEQIGGLCLLRLKGTYSAEEIAEKLGFRSVEVMRIQLKNWGMPDWMIGEEPATSRAKSKDRKKSDRERRARGFGPAKELPPADRATELFKEKHEALISAAEGLRHRNETLQGKRFVGTEVYTDPVYFPRESFSDEQWQELCELYDLGPSDKGFLDTNAVTRMPTGATQSPSEPLTTLIGVYALAGGRLDLLLEALHPDPASIDAETWEKMRRCVEEEKAVDDKDGLKALARQLAAWVRGGKVGKGAPSPGLTSIEHNLACTITQYRKDGWSDEEIYQEMSRFGLSRGEVTRLGDLGLSWS